MNRNYITQLKTWARAPSKPTVLFYNRNDSCLGIDVFSCNLNNNCFSDITPENIKKFSGYKLLGSMRFKIVNTKLECSFCSVDGFMLPNCDAIKKFSDGHTFEESLFLYLVIFPRRF